MGKKLEIMGLEFKIARDLRRLFWDNLLLSRRGKNRNYQGHSEKVYKKRPYEAR